MKISLFVLGVIFCSFASIQCSDSGEFDEFCEVPVFIRTIILQCMEEHVPADQKRVFNKIARCFNEASFTDVMNGLCQLTDSQIDALDDLHEDCLTESEENAFDEPDVNEAEFEKCIENKLSR
uniref:TxLP8 n=1 Tax=Lychas mucronatus TaxID=172552 RepID=A0A0U1TZI4_LYCMC|nr:TxLP8 [Lychas mucronatus]